MNIWPAIEEFQKQLPGYTERERKWEKFNRDIEIFWKYVKRKRLEKEGTKDVKRIYEEFYEVIKEKYNISSQTTRKIISRIRDLLSPLR